MPLKQYDRYGLSETEWAALSFEQREIHYNRWVDRQPADACHHHYEYPGVNGDKTDQRLRASYSFDPYFHTRHMEPCKRWGIKPPGRYKIECHCQMCLQKIGIPREGMDSFPTLKAVVSVVVSVTVLTLAGGMK